MISSSRVTMRSILRFQLKSISIRSIQQSTRSSSSFNLTEFMKVHESKGFTKAPTSTDNGKKKPTKGQVSRYGGQRDFKNIRGGKLDNAAHKNSNRNKKEKLLIDASGTPKDREAVKIVFKQIRAINPKGICKLIRSGKDEGIVSLGSISRTLDLSENGLKVLSTTKSDRDQDIAVVKIIDSQEARKHYTEHLSSLVQQDLLNSNNRTVKKQLRQQQDLAEQGTNNVKVIRLTWQISLNDLKGQKKNEILTQFKKGETVQIIVDDKDNFDSDGNAVSTRPQNLSDLERTLRERISETLDEIVNELGTSPDKVGKLNSRLVINLKPEVKKELSKDEKKKLKEQKKLEKQKKIQERAAKNKAQIESEIKLLVVE